MRFQHVKPEELEGPIKLTGFSDWTGQMSNGPGVSSLLLAAPPGNGKGSAIGQLAETLHYDVVRCRLKQLLEYPDPTGEFRAMLQGTEHLNRTVIWLDGLDGFFGKLKDDAAGQQFLAGWLASEREPLRKNEVIVVATVKEPASMPDSVSSQFDRCFSA